MKKIVYVLMAIVLITMVAGYNVYFSRNTVKMSDLALANVEALAEIETTENGTNCPEPYDVYDHQLGFTQRTGRFTLNADCEFTILGKKFKALGFSGGATITVTYELGNCTKYSPKNCCPNSRNGEIKIISKS